MAAVLCLLPAAGHDQLWFLLMARRWLGGATLYGPEIFDANPPLIVWLSAIPVDLGQRLHVPATLAAKALVLLACVSVAFFSLRLLPRIWRPLEQGEPPALLFAFLTIVLIFPARDLGQRDALAALLAIPYVLASVPLREDRLARGERLGAVSLAALAFCLKPQVCLVAVAIEVCSFVVRRWSAHPSPKPQWGSRFSLEIPVLLVAGLLYLLAIRTLTPLYLSQALPLLRNTYWAIGHLSFLGLLTEAPQLFLLLLLLLALAWRSQAVSPAVRTLFVAGCGGTAAYLLQKTGWYYQQLPALTFFAAALSLHLLDLQHRYPLRLHAWSVPAVAALCVLAITLTTHFSGYPFTTDRSFAISSPDPGFFHDLPPGTSVAILTTSVDEAMMPVERYGLTWAGRTNNLWLMPAILRSQSLASDDPAQHLTPLGLARLRDTQQRWMVEDLQRWRPRLVLVERCQAPEVQCQVLEDRHDDLLAWFGRDPAFAALWRQYRLIATRGRFDAYTLEPRR